MFLYSSFQPDTTIGRPVQRVERFLAPGEVGTFFDYSRGGRSVIAAVNYGDSAGAEVFQLGHSARVTSTTTDTCTLAIRGFTLDSWLADVMPGQRFEHPVVNEDLEPGKLVLRFVARCPDLPAAE